MTSVTKLLLVRVFLTGQEYRNLCKAARVAIGDEDKTHYKAVVRGRYETLRVYLVHIPTGSEVLLRTI